MTVSVFDLFTIGIGPSSSHTVGPMRASRRFAERVDREYGLERIAGITVELFGSLGHTGKGHGSDRAILLGLEGEAPETIDPDTIETRIAGMRARQEVVVLGRRPIPFDESRHLIFHRHQALPAHPNGMRFCARNAEGETILCVEYYSIGGGFVREGHEGIGGEDARIPFPFRSAAELLQIARTQGIAISDIVLANECARRSENEVRTRLNEIWEAMQACVRRGCAQEGVLPGGLALPRRAPALYRLLAAAPDAHDPLRAMDWIDLYALAVNEENAAGGRVVTAPTNGAAGIVPAVLHYYRRFHVLASNDGVHRFLLTAGAIAALYKENASISGAEVGCQGEVGVACSMAAAGLTEVLGGSPAQVENAAEIGMEHNLGLTCDPVGGLVQIPCIERNAMGAVKAVNAARLALRGDGRHRVSLDRVIATMRETGADMQSKYKETSRGGLAVNVIEC